MKAKYLYLLALAVAAIDQVSKHGILASMSFGSSVPIIGNVFRLTLIENRGGAFGIFQSLTGPLTFITLAAVASVVYLVRCKGDLPMLMSISLGLLMGGAIGNLIDRLRFGYVVDFIEVSIWPVFNFADIAITVGIALLAYCLLFCEGHKSENAAGC